MAFNNPDPLCSEPGNHWCVSKALETLEATKDINIIWLISTLPILRQSALIEALSDLPKFKLSSCLEEDERIKKISTSKGGQRGLAILELFGVQASAINPKVSWEPPSLPSDMQPRDIAVKLEQEIWNVATAIPIEDWIRYAFGVDAYALDGLFGFSWQWHGYLLSESRSPEIRSKIASVLKVRSIGICLTTPILIISTAPDQPSRTLGPRIPEQNQAPSTSRRGTPSDAQRGSFSRG